MFKARGLYFDGRAFEVSANTSWWRWNEFGFVLKFQHNPGPGGIRELRNFKDEYLLWWQFGWINGHFKLACRRKNVSAVHSDRGLFYVVYGLPWRGRKKITWRGVKDAG